MKIKTLVIIGILLIFSSCENKNNSSFELFQTHYNRDYNEKMSVLGKPMQETPWGFQEISLKNTIEHYVDNIQKYKTIIAKNTKKNQWIDGKVHIIHFEAGKYFLPKGNTYYIMLVPSQTIIEGAGMEKTKFIAREEIEKNDKYHFRKAFNLEYASHDVVMRNFSFYNETKDNKWGLIHSNGSVNRENYLFENIEFDDVFGSIGKKGYKSNFITFRGLHKRIGNTTKRIKKNFKLPIPINFQFLDSNKKNVELAGQIGVRDGNGIVFHNCILGDTISASIDIYSNYIEMLGITFIDPLLDHSVKAPSANHLYIHDSSFSLTYREKIIDNTYWNPTFYTHQGGSSLINYHFKNLSFKRVGEVFNKDKKRKITKFVESEPFMIYDNRASNISGDMIWENISFDGYAKEHQVLGYPNVQTHLGYEAINYTKYKALAAQMRENNNNSRGKYVVNIKSGKGSSKIERKGVYSWGENSSQSIDYPRDNRDFKGNKSDSIRKKYIKMNSSSIKDIYNKKLNKK